MISSKLCNKQILKSKISQSPNKVADTEWASPGPFTSGAVDDNMFGLEQTLKSSETRDFFDIEEQEKSLISRSLGMLQVGLEIF